MQKQYCAGDIIPARGRDWIIVIPPEGDNDMLVAEPLARADERRAQAVIEMIIAKGKMAPTPPMIAAQRSTIDLDEISEPLAA